MWEERAYSARRDIAELAASGLGVSELHAAAIRVIGRDVATELTCWATLDPESLVISAMTSGETRIPVEYEPLLVEAELSQGEPHTFAAMASQRETLIRFSDFPRRERDRSLRYRNVWHPLGVEQEVRLLFAADGATWGAAGLVRSGADFSDRELAYLAAVAPAIAAATRLAVRSEISERLAAGPPAIVVLSPSGDVRSATPPALEWEERLNALEPGWFSVMMRVMGVECGARLLGYLGRISATGGDSGHSSRPAPSPEATPTLLPFPSTLRSVSSSRRCCSRPMGCRAGNGTSVAK
jgi:hypothetical protein